MTKEEARLSVMGAISMALEDPILQQGFEIICKENAELEKENAELKNNNKVYCEGNGETLVVNVSFDSFTRINANHKMYYPHNNELEKENAELKKIAEFQQSSNMNTHLENKKLKEGLEVGSILNKGLNHLNKTLEEERDKYRNMVFDKDEQLTKAKEIIGELFHYIPSWTGKENDKPRVYAMPDKLRAKAEQFLNSEVEK